MAYTMRREVSLDWHPNAVDSSQGGGSSTWGSRDTILSSGKSQVDLVDASIQVDLSGTCLIYDSDDDTTRNRKKMTSAAVNLERSRKGHPLYSKEDIKEQYCISNKQLKVLQRRRSWKLFTSCLSPDDNSLVTCSPRDVISCVNKHKSDDVSNRPYSLPQKEKSQPWGPKSGIENLKNTSKQNGGNSGREQGSNSPDDDFANSYFRKRPKSFCLSDPKVKFSWLNSENKEPIGESRILKVGSRSVLSKSYDYCRLNSSLDSGKRERSSLKSIGQSRSLDLLDNDDKNATSDSMESTNSCWNKKKILAGSAGILDVSGSSGTEDRRRKHVSFDSTSIIRDKCDSYSVDFETCQEEGPNATSTPMVQRSDRSPMTSLPPLDFGYANERLRSGTKDIKERLIEPNRSKEKIMMNDTCQTDDSLDAWSLSQHNMSSSSSSIRLKKSNMKTQSTQTELKEQKMMSKYEIPPAYLTLSPRLRYKSTNRSSDMMEDQAVQTSESIIDSSENETIESIIVTKYVLNGKRKKCRPKSLPVTPIQDTTNKEIMVSFKPQMSVAPSTRLAANETKEVDIHKEPIATKAVDNENSDKNAQKKNKSVIYTDIITITGNIGHKEDKDLEKVPSKPESSTEMPKDNSEYYDVTETEPAFEESDDPFSTDAKDTSLDITSLLETSPPSPSHGMFISDSPIDPPPNFACTSPVIHSPPRRPILQCYSLDLPSKPKVSFCPQSVSLDNMLLISPESKSSNEYFTASSVEEFIVSDVRRHSASPSVSLERVTDLILTNQQRVSVDESVDGPGTLRRNSSSSSRKGTLKRDKHVEYEDDNILCQDQNISKSRCKKRMSSTGEGSDDYTLTLEDEYSDESPTMTPRTGGAGAMTPEDELDECKSLEATKNVHEKKISKKDLCSPETDSSSSHFTGRESSKSGGSVETLKSESDHENQETSAEYVTATDNSHRSRQQDGRTSLDSISSAFSSPRDILRSGKVDNEPVTNEQKKQLAVLQEAVINHKQQQRKHFLKEKMARLERRRRQIERGMCSTSTESSNSGSYVIESMCKDDSREAILEIEDGARATEYPIEVNVKTNDPIDSNGSPKNKCYTQSPQEDKSMDLEVGKLKKHSSADGLESSFVVRDKRRTRSASRSPDDTLSTNAHSQGLIRDSPMAHSHTGVFPIENGRRSAERFRSDVFSSKTNISSREGRRRRERLHSKSASTESASVRSTASLSSFNTPYHDGSSLSITTIEGADDDDIGVHSESYRSATWLYINSHDEAAVWRRAKLQEDGEFKLHKSPSVESTTSEKEFEKKYQSITHRMVHRRASVEMFRKMAKGGKLGIVYYTATSVHNTYFTFADMDKSVKIERQNQEFGFRINGSRPVVVSAIEPDTPAESCSLEIGDIIISINDINVLDYSHSDVVKLAHTGVDVLTLEIARTIDLVNPHVEDSKEMEFSRNRHTGNIYKLCDGGKTWKRRWLSLDHETKILLFYKTSQDKEPSGVIYLPHYKPPEQLPDDEQPFTFQLQTHTPGGQPLIFAAVKQSEASRWMCLITDVLTTVQIDPFVNKSVRNACLPPTAIEKPDCQGYLGNLCSQKGNKATTWRRRYYILKDACIYIYSDYYAENAIGVYHLHGYRVQTCVISGKRSTFEALPPNQKLKQFQFLAESDFEKKKWLAALEYSIDRWMKLS